MWQQKSIRSLLITVGIIGILVIGLVVLFGYTPDTSVAFPYIPPPEKGYHIEATYAKFAGAFVSQYANPKSAEAAYKGESFIFKNVGLGGISHWKTETYITTGIVQFWALCPSDLRKLKEGDRVDIIGFCAGLSEVYQSVVILEDCLFLPVGLAPLPLPGGPVFAGGY